MIKELTISDILSIFFKRFWIIALCITLCGGVAYSYAKFVIDPIYTSKGMLFVNNNNSQRLSNNINAGVSISDLAVAQRLVDTYIVILKSDRFLNIISNETNLGYSIGKLRNMISLSAVNETEVLEVKVNSGNPQHSAIIVQSLLQNSKDEIMRVVEAGSVKIIDNASYPLLPSEPSIPRNTMFGLVFGIFLSIGIIILLEFLDTTIKDEEDLERNYNIPILGSIPELEI